VKRAKATVHYLPGSPESAVYNGLSAVQTKAPPKRLKRVDRSAQPRRPRALTDSQRATFLGTAAERVREEAKARKCKWLRDFDDFQKSGYRTNQKRWDSLAEIIEPILARMDIATMVLGYIDSKTGDFHLNRQRGLAEDTSLQEWTVSRLMAALETSGYVRRKMRRICHNGRYWITRVTINVRPRFFIHLGLGHQLAEARTQKKAKRNQLLASFGKKRAIALVQAAGEHQVRKQSHDNAQRKRRQQEAEAEARNTEEKARARAAAWTTFMADPDNQAMPMAKRIKLFNSTHPHL
jgi:DNA-binding MarR family transcriptional regulator